MVYAIAGLAILLFIVIGLVIHGRNIALASQVEAAEQRMEATEKALSDFTAAISEYAHHLSSHTGAIQGLAEASQELRKSAAFQNSVILNLIKNTEDALIRKEALLSTVNKPPGKGAPEDARSSREKVYASYRALHPLIKPGTEPEEAVSEERRTVFETANLIEAIVLPYYRAMHKLEQQRESTGDDEAIARAKKAVEAIMLPFYRTLYQAAPPDKSTYDENAEP